MSCYTETGIRLTRRGRTEQFVCWQTREGGEKKQRCINLPKHGVARTYTAQMSLVLLRDCAPLLHVYFSAASGARKFNQKCLGKAQRLRPICQCLCFCSRFKQCIIHVGFTVTMLRTSSRVDWINIEAWPYFAELRTLALALLTEHTSTTKAMEDDAGVCASVH